MEVTQNARKPILSKLQGASTHSAVEAHAEEFFIPRAIGSNIWENATHDVHLTPSGGVMGENAGENVHPKVREQRVEFLDEQIPTINDNSTQDEIEAHQKHYDDANKVSCIMASSMSPELQKTFEFTWAYEMNQQLKEMFQAKASKERLDVVKSLMACKPKPGASICAFVLEMKGYFDRLESLNMVFDVELSINIIISGLPADYNQFVLSYQMNGKETSIMELHCLLQTAEQGIKKIDVLTVGHNAKKRKTYHSKWKEKAAKGKSDRGSKRKFESEIAPTGDPKEAVCFYYNTKGRWKCSCPKYMKDLRYDLKESRKLKHGELNLVMGNRKITPVTKIGKYELMLNVQKVSKRSREPTGQKDKETAAHILNLVPTKKVSKTPFEMWKGKRPSLGHIKIWGCEVFVRREAQDKLEARSEKCLFVGYPKESFGYLFYKPKDNVVFSVDEEPIVNTDSQQEVVTPVEPNDVSLPIRRTSRVSKPPQDPQFYYGFHIEEDKISDSTLSELDEPANYKEAMASPEAAKWKEAIKSEIQSMYDNQVWNLVDTTTGLKTVGLAKIKSIRIMLAIAAFHDYEIWQMDVKTAFLNGKLTEDVFMAQPEGFENAKYPKRVCKLQKAIYGLKQASRSWNLCFHEKVTQFGFSRSEDESCPITLLLSARLVRHQQNPGEGHWTAVKNILKYLRNTKDRFLVYGGEKELRVLVIEMLLAKRLNDSRSQSVW
ncbi:RNA-directed DNA polymerase, eukaryota [Tanacetum coccineum]|uniref:RNA-directed DNA polymerase, eukaryota n=1 Tax=Tanacetum coccineum TaxID=301880 RepID=A0ABQ4YAM2_9ASTR